MSKLKNQFIRVLLIATTVCASGLWTATYAQNYEDARSYAFKGDLKKAMSICSQILLKEYDSDVVVLLGRIYAWEAKYDSSRVVINNLLKKSPDNLEAFDVLSDVEFWSGNYAEALGYCEKALSKDSANVGFLLKKANILHEAGNTEEASIVLERLLKQNKKSPEAIQKLDELRVVLKKNEIKLQYIYDYFQEDFDRSPWNMFSMQYSRKLKFGTVIPRVNLAEKFANKGVQAEVDFWPTFNKKNYGYINYGFSSSSVFPENRFGVELYHNFPKSFEGSLGFRLLDFGTVKTDIYTATFGKYFGNNWTSLRGFMTPDSSGVSLSGIFLMRHYFGDPKNYLNLKLGYGISPDDNRNLVNSELNSRLNLKTGTIRVEYNHIFYNSLIVNFGGAISNEEIRPKQYSNYFTLDLSASYLF